MLITYRSCFTDWAIRNAICWLIIYVNFTSSPLSTVCALYQKLRPFRQFRCNCTRDRRYL